MILDKLDYCGTLKNLAAAAAAPGFKFIKGDLQSGDLLSYILSTERIDTVMHFAAQARCANLRAPMLYAGRLVLAPRDPPALSTGLWFFTPCVRKPQRSLATHQHSSVPHTCIFLTWH